MVQTCRSLCGAIVAECRDDCDDFCDAFSLIAAGCAREAGALLECYAQNANCREESGELDLPRGRCRGELVESMNVSEFCLDELFD